MIIYTEMILDCDWSISVQLIPNRYAKICNSAKICNKSAKICNNSQKVCNNSPKICNNSPKCCNSAKFCNKLILLANTNSHQNINFVAVGNSKIKTTRNQCVHSHLVSFISKYKLLSSNSMVSLEIWEKHTLMSFSKTHSSMFFPNCTRSHTITYTNTPPESRQFSLHFGTVPS